MIPTILAVDDEQVNLSLITTLLKNENYRVVTAENGLEAWILLKKAPEDYNAVLLDRMMPKMNGMEVLAKMKAHDVLKMVPVIFQTSMAKKEEILEGLRAGVDYYLTKPLKKDILLAIVKTALSGHLIYKSLWEDLRNISDTRRLTRSGYFEIQTMDEGQELASLLASVCPRSDKVALGLWELMLNAIEHGNLGITYQEKAQLVETDKWFEEVERRMALPENASKKVMVWFESSDDDIRFLIRDHGPGFDWKAFEELNPERAFDPNGRGIHLSRTVSFDRIEYKGGGNEVLAVIHKISGS